MKIIIAIVILLIADVASAAMTVGDLKRFVNGSVSQREGAIGYLAGIRDGIAAVALTKNVTSIDLDCLNALTPDDIYTLITENEKLTDRSLASIFLGMRINVVCAADPKDS